MTYTESLKSGHIAVWNPNKSSLNVDCDSTDIESLANMILISDIYAVNAINQMIDSARDL